MVSSDTELKQLLDEQIFDFHFNCGYSKPTRNMTIDDKSTLINAIWLHFTFFPAPCRATAAEKGFRDALQVELLVCLYPDEIRSLLCACTMYDITAAFLLDSFVTHYSDDGTNRRILEEAVMLNWSEYVVNCSGTMNKL